ncbi:MAG: TRAP transporter substrate-binding protein [Clostridiales Family XIII bacterium]|jgi:TRAP-type C4-dicarboxylate transport system substrate-binding protein|nr:TRAP transporter substrate-binding protein [Clostridiales Family XIII bacterium]
MKKRMVLILWLSAVVLIFASCGATGNSGSDGNADAPSESTVTLKLAHGHPATSMYGEMYDAFSDLVGTLSNGSIIVEVYPAGTLLTDTDTLDAIIAGTVDFAHDTPSRESGVIKDIAAMEIPGFYVGSDWVKLAETVQAPIADIYRDFDIKYMGAVYEGEATFVAINKQIKNPSDINGMAFRAAGTWISKAIAAWGGSPTTIPLNDLSTALERHTVDGAFAPWPVTVPQKLYEAADYVSFSDLANFGCLLMSQGSYDSLSPDQQKIIDEASRQWPKLNYEIGSRYYDSYYKEVEDYGTHTYKLTDAENEAFSNLVKPLFDEYAETCSPKGEALLDALQSLE